MSARTPNQVEGRWLQILRRIGEHALEPEPDIRPWIEAKRIPIPPQHNRQAAAEGKTWEWSDMPIVADWIFDFLKNPTTPLLFSDGTVRPVTNRTASLMKDSQSGVTSIYLHGVAWWLAFRGGNVILITDNRQQARDFARDRVLSVLDAYPELARGKDDEGSTALAIRYSRGTLYLGGGQSSSEVVSKPASLTGADEVAKHALINGMASLKLLEGRITGDDQGKQLAFSTPDDALEYEKNPVTGKLEPKITQETVIHSSYLQGTQERVEFPCPHCGHYQAPDFFKHFRFDHCKESLDGVEKPLWNKERVMRETWYQCLNPDCTDRRPDGTARGKIEEHHKRSMVERRRIVGTNLQYKPGHRSLQIGALFNLAFTSRSWGAIANAFITAGEEGGDVPLKAFYTEYLGLPFPRFRASADSLLQVKKLRRGYRRIGHDGTALLKIPFKTDEIKFLGLIADRQQHCVKWDIYAFGYDGQITSLDYGRCQELDDLPDVIDRRVFTDKDGEEWTVVLVYVDSQYLKHATYRFLAEQNQNAEFNGGGYPRWEAIAGRDPENTKALKVTPHQCREYPVLDESKQATQLVVRVHNINADHYEAELHIERIAKVGTEYHKAPAFNLPSDIEEDYLAELANAEQYHTKPNHGGLQELRWRKKRTAEPNDRADGARYAIVMWDAVLEEESEEQS